MADTPITLTHPETGGIFLAVSEDQAESLALDGWVPAADDAVTSRTKKELVALAAERGVDVDPSATKADIAAAIGAGPPAKE